MSDEVTRRAMMGLAAVGAGALFMAKPAEAADDKPAKAPTTDRECIMAAGMTAEEAEVWELAAKTAGKFFELPLLHPSDAAEVAQAIHIIQNKLLARPTYRKYVELAKKMRGK